MKKIIISLVILIFGLVLFVGCGVVTPDTTAPVITLLGENSVNLNVGDDYVDAGATAFDNVDGDITANIIIVNPVDTSIAGTYIVTYNASDSAGNAADEATRTVNVVGASVEILQLIREYTNYDVVCRWADGEVSVCDTTGQTKEIWDEINEIIDGPVVFKLTNDTSAQVGIQYWPVSGAFFVGFSGTSNNVFGGCGIGINPATASEEVFVGAILAAVGINIEKRMEGFTDEMKTVIYWLYRLELGYSLM
jgi:hypothetical protein